MKEVDKITYEILDKLKQEDLESSLQEIVNEVNKKYEMSLIIDKTIDRYCLLKDGVKVCEYVNILRLISGLISVMQFINVTNDVETAFNGLNIYTKQNAFK